MSWAPLGLGHVLQSSVEYVQVNNVLDLLKVEERRLDEREQTFPENTEDFVEHVVLSLLCETAKDFIQSQSSPCSK